MAAFLSAEWVDALDERLTRSGPSATSLTVQYLVERSEDVAAYYVSLGPGGDSAAMGRAIEPDVTFLMDEDTAREVSAGELSSEEAFITGRLRLEGDPNALIDAYRADA